MTYPVDSHEPEISVITISRDDLDGFRRTIQSVRDQTFENFEIVAVVHDSSESTLKIARALVLEDTRIRLVVDTKNGIYQAMNTGIEHARGKYLVFMNSGDVFSGSASMNSLFQKIYEEGAVLVIGSFKVRNRKRNSSEIFEGQVTAESFAFNRNWGCHQAMIFRKFKNQKFDLQYALASDFDFVLSYFDFGKVFRISDCVAEVSPGGSADSNLRRVYSEKFRIRSRRLMGFQNVIINYVWTFLALVKLYLKNLR